VGVGAVLLREVGRQPASAAGLTGVVAGHLEDAAAAHPVTAVLLDFRGYDTWLEVTVLLAAAVAATALGGLRALGPSTPALEERTLLPSTLRLTLPLLVLTAGHLLLVGAQAPGGAFQAGAVLSAAALLAWLGGHRALAALDRRRLAPLLAGGTLVFLVVGAGALLLGRRLLEYPARGAGPLVLAVEAAVALSVAGTLTVLFVAAPPRSRP
jgi:multisubunit Na+/H+ antiporter MnhB subunit